MLTWLRKLLGGGGGSAPPAPDPPGPDLPAALYRTEEETRAGGRTVRRLYNCRSGPEWLQEKLEAGRDRAGPGSAAPGTTPGGPSGGSAPGRARK